MIGMPKFVIVHSAKSDASSLQEEHIENPLIEDKSVIFNQL